MTSNRKIRCAFVSTNSICQGEQIKPLWDKILNEYQMKIDFAYRTFIWSNEAKGNAAVHCIIVAFSDKNNKTNKFIVNETGEKKKASCINPYLVDAPEIMVDSRSKPICNSPRVTKGNQPSDGGFLILSREEKDEMIRKDPRTERFIHSYVGSVEYINGGDRYCLWLSNEDRSWIECKEILERIENVRTFRQKSSAKPTREKAETPHMFFSVVQPNTKFIVIPRVSSSRRDYIPIGFMEPEVIASDGVSIVHSDSYYVLGVLMSKMHMLWVKNVGGRLKSDYRYSGSVVYNTFPWPDCSIEQKKIIEQCVKDVLEIRSKYDKDTLADLYDPLKMPVELKKAHHQLDIGVEKSYTDKIIPDDNSRIALLFEEYSKRLTDD